jgi:RimJ/RimL family protein N-acetyltransferase
VKSAEPELHEPPLALLTPRLLLRDMTEADVDTIARYFAEPQSRSSILQRQRNPAHVARQLDGMARYNGHYHWRMRESFAFSAQMRESGSLIGHLSLANAVPDGEDSRIGWHFSTAYAGRGLATEAAAAGLRFAFETIGIARIIGDCNQANEASVRIFTKIGMHPFEQGYWRSRWRAFRYGQPVPVARFALDRAQWLQRAR